MPKTSKSFAIALVPIALIAATAPAATVKYILDYPSPGRFTLSAQTSLGDNAGLAAYSVPLSGHVLTLDHVSPVVINQNARLAGFGDIRSDDMPNGGFNPIIVGSQATTFGPIANLIYGFGQTAGDWEVKGITPFVSPDPTYPDPTHEDDWYTTLVLATGTFSGGLYFNETSPNLVANVFAAQGQRTAPQATIELGGNVFLDIFDTSDGFIDNVDGANAGLLRYTFPISMYDAPTSWENFGFDLYQKSPSATGAPAIPATFDPATHMFSWDPAGSPLGFYTWHVTARTTNESDVRFITVHITAPEPSAVSLVVLAMAFCSGPISRRRG